VLSLSREHDAARFDCGNPVLNLWLQRTALQHQRHGTSKTLVLVDSASPKTILGYFSIAVRGLTPACDLPPEIAKRLPRAVAGYTIARLAVAKGQQGKKFGARLLFEAMERIYNAAQLVGGFAVFVDSKDGAVQFYEHFGVLALPKDPQTLMLPIASIPHFPHPAP
jgi:GNAT superfamily N-acetyltransferase